MTKTIKTIPIKPFRYQFGPKRKKIYDLKKERGEIFTHNGKTYVCDGFLPEDSKDGPGIFASEIDSEQKE